MRDISVIQLVLGALLVFVPGFWLGWVCGWRDRAQMGRR
jgi:hypothetical protein